MAYLAGFAIGLAFCLGYGIGYKRALRACHAWYVTQAVERGEVVILADHRNGEREGA